MRCQKCGHEKQVLGGCSAHEDNWYCEVCELRARVAESEGKVDQLAELNADLMFANKALRARVAKYAPLQPPSDSGREVFESVVKNNPDADMRAVPNEWVTNQRAITEEVVKKLEARVAELEAERDRLRGENERLKTALHNAVHFREGVEGEIERQALRVRVAELEAALENILLAMPPTRVYIGYACNQYHVTYDAHGSDPFKEARAALQEGE